MRTFSSFIDLRESYFLSGNENSICVKQKNIKNFTETTITVKYFLILQALAIDLTTKKSFHMNYIEAQLRQRTSTKIDGSGGTNAFINLCGGSERREKKFTFL